MICQNESFKRFPSSFLCKIGYTRAEPKYDPQEIILTFFITSHQMRLHAKYECFSPYGLSQEDFTRFPSLILCKIVCAHAEPKFDPKGIILTLFIKGH